MANPDTHKVHSFFSIIWFNWMENINQLRANWDAFATTYWMEIMQTFLLLTLNKNQITWRSTANYIRFVLMLFEVFWKSDLFSCCVRFFRRFVVKAIPSLGLAKIHDNDVNVGWWCCCSIELHEWPPCTYIFQTAIHKQTNISSTTKKNQDE